MKFFLSQASGHYPNEVGLIFIMTFSCIYNLPLIIIYLSTSLSPTASPQRVKLNFNRADLISNVVNEVPENYNYVSFAFLCKNILVLVSLLLFLLQSC
jgi:hypothetical protein